MAFQVIVFIAVIAVIESELGVDVLPAYVAFNYSFFLLDLFD